MTRLLTAALVLLLAAASNAVAEEVTVQNDSFVSGGPAFVVGGFVIGEHAGARMQVPCDGTLVAVQVGWLQGEGFPDPDPTIEEAIHVYDGTTFPNPGNELLLLSGPVMTPGFLNEFRYLDQKQQEPIALPVLEGQWLTVTLEFANTPNILAGDASVFRDLDGCQPFRNVLFAPNLGGWVNFCIFLEGDLVIRMVIDCAEGAGACCFVNGTCLELQEADCTQSQGDFQGEGVLCDDITCPVATEACCFTGGGCLDLPPASCGGAGGVPQGAGTECMTTVCFPTGACCLVDQTCIDDTSPDDCANMDGAYQGDSSDCSQITCPAALGACCFPTPFCLDLTEADCELTGTGTWAGALTDCEDADMNNVADDCESAPCPEDLNGGGSVEFGDILVILTAWGNGGGPEDLDGSGTVDFGDILVVLSAWGACP